MTMRICLDDLEASDNNTDENNVWAIADDHSVIMTDGGYTSDLEHIQEIVRNYSGYTPKKLTDDISVGSHWGDGTYTHRPKEFVDSVIELVDSDIKFTEQSGSIHCEGYSAQMNLRCYVDKKPYELEYKLEEQFDESVSIEVDASDGTLEEIAEVIKPYVDDVGMAGMNDFSKQKLRKIAPVPVDFKDYYVVDVEVFIKAKNDVLF